MLEDKIENLFINFMDNEVVRSYLCLYKFSLDKITLNEIKILNEIILSLSKKSISLTADCRHIMPGEIVDVVKLQDDVKSSNNDVIPVSTAEVNKFIDVNNYNADEKRKAFIDSAINLTCVSGYLTANDQINLNKLFSDLSLTRGIKSGIDINGVGYYPLYYREFSKTKTK